MKLPTVQAKDFGRWTCFAGGRAAKIFEVSQALKPRSVFLETISETFEARCVVKKARPRPKFVWYLDDVLLVDFNATDFEGFIFFFVFHIF